VEVYRDKPGEVIYQGVYCRLTIECLGAGVVVVRISGRDVGEFGAAPMDDLAALIANENPVALFIDARSVQGASLDVSNDWAQWLGRHRGSFRHISMLTRSRFIQITADFVRRFAGLGDLMRVYTEATAFDDALESEAVGGLKRA
jgi:hypothetical protein